MTRLHSRKRTRTALTHGSALTLAPVLALALVACGKNGAGGSGAAVRRLQVERPAPTRASAPVERPGRAAQLPPATPCSCTTRISIGTAFTCSRP